VLESKVLEGNKSKTKETISDAGFSFASSSKSA